MDGVEQNCQLVKRLRKLPFAQNIGKKPKLDLTWLLAKLSEATKLGGKMTAKRGWRHSKEARQLRSHNSLGEKNPNWKGDKVGYFGLHVQIKSRKPKPLLCEICQSAPPLDLTSINDCYQRSLNSWRWLCRKCHMESDDRMGNLLVGKIPRRER